MLSVHTLFLSFGLRGLWVVFFVCYMSFFLVELNEWLDINFHSLFLKFLCCSSGPLFSARGDIFSLFCSCNISLLPYRVCIIVKRCVFTLSKNFFSEPQQKRSGFYTLFCDCMLSTQNRAMRPLVRRDKRWIFNFHVWQSSTTTTMSNYINFCKVSHAYVSATHENRKLTHTTVRTDDEKDFLQLMSKSWARKW